MPPPLVASTGAKAFARASVPKKFVSKIRRSSSADPVMESPADAMPALLINRSTSDAAFPARTMSSEFVMSSEMT